MRDKINEGQLRTGFDFSIGYGSSRKPAKIELGASDFYLVIQKQASANIVQISYDSKTLPFEGGPQLLATLPMQDDESESFAFVGDALKRITQGLKDERNV